MTLDEMNIDKMSVEKLVVDEMTFKLDNYQSLQILMATSLT